MAIIRISASPFSLSARSNGDQSSDGALKSLWWATSLRQSGTWVRFACGVSSEGFHLAALGVIDVIRNRQRDRDEPRAGGRFLGRPGRRFQPQHIDFRQHGRAPWFALKVRRRRRAGGSNNQWQRTSIGSRRRPLANWGARLARLPSTSRYTRISYHPVQNLQVVPELELIILGAGRLANQSPQRLNGGWRAAGDLDGVPDRIREPPTL
jgi:hypothetical protein